MGHPGVYFKARAKLAPGTLPRLWLVRLSRMPSTCPASGAYKGREDHGAGGRRATLQKAEPLSDHGQKQRSPHDPSAQLIATDGQGSHKE